MSVSNMVGNLKRFYLPVNSSYFALEHVAHDRIGLELSDLFLGLRKVHGGLTIIEARLLNLESVAHAVIVG